MSPLNRASSFLFVVSGRRLQLIRSDSHAVSFGYFLTRVLNPSNLPSVCTTPAQVLPLPLMKMPVVTAGPRCGLTRGRGQGRSPALRTLTSHSQGYSQLQQIGSQAYHPTYTGLWLSCWLFLGRQCGLRPCAFRRNLTDRVIWGFGHCGHALHSAGAQESDPPTPTPQTGVSFITDLLIHFWGRARGTRIPLPPRKWTGDPARLQSSHLGH